MIKVFFNTIALTLIVLCLVVSADSQTKNRKIAQKRPVAGSASQPETNEKAEKKNTDQVKEETQIETVVPPKRNERKTAVPTNADAPVRPPKTFDLTKYSYEFSQPEFYLSTIRIEHDDTGKGTITFIRKDADEEITDPLSISARSIENLNAYFDELDFLNSTENYQYSKDYSHLGNVKITLARAGRQRTTSYNWTENKAARGLAAEYRKISNQYVWAFDINLARENQKLETPRIMERLEGFLRRDEISDPPQLLPFLTELSNDERLPLMARNRATRLIEQIRKKAEKDKK